MARIESICLGLQNKNRAKYGTSLYLLKTLENLNVYIDWEKLKYILMDTKEFLNFPSSFDYLNNVVYNLLEIKGFYFLFDRDRFKELNKNSEKYFYEIFTINEVRFFNELYISFIKLAVQLFKTKDKKIMTIAYDTDTLMEIFKADSIEEMSEEFARKVDIFFSYHQFSPIELKITLDNSKIVYLEFHII